MTEDLAQHDITVAVVNYNSTAHTLSLLECLADEDVARVVVVDNLSTITEREALKEGVARYSRVTVVWGSRNVGFGAGVNLAAKCLDVQPEQFLWVINPDVRPQKGTGRRLADVLRNTDYEIVSPLLVRKQRNSLRIVYAGGRLDWRRGITDHELWDEPMSAAGTGLRSATFMTGAAFMTTGRAWHRLGGFREDYFLYWEDADLSAKALKCGMPMAVVRGAVAEHDTSGSSEGRGRGLVYYRYMAQNRERFLHEWAQNRSIARRITQEVHTLRLLVRAAREPADRFAKMGMVVRGRIAGGLVVRGQRGELLK